MSIRDRYGLNETAVLTFKDGNDDPMLGDDGKPCTAVIYGPGTKRHMQATAHVRSDTIERMQRKGKIKQSGDQLRQENADYAADVTKSFSENIAREFPGLEGHDLALAVYSDEKIGYLFSEQVSVFQKDTSNFTKGSLKP